MGERLYFVYILASRRNGTLYVGVTNDIARRTWEHKNDLVQGFTKKYGVHILVYYELHEDINAAIALRTARPGMTAFFSCSPFVTPYSLFAARHSL